MKNRKGITLISLVITIIVLLILASIATYSGINVIRSSKFTAFTTELKIMQTQVNSIYQKYKDNDTINIDGTSYIGSDILEIGEELNEESTTKEQANKVFKQEESGIVSQDGYRYWSSDLIKELGIEGVEKDFFVNIEKRSIVSYEGFEYEGITYYTLEQIPDGLYNVEYEDPNTSKQKPTFDVKIEKIGTDKWKITVSNIKYEGYINKWQVKYKLVEEDNWNSSEDLSFVVNKKGNYEIKIQNGIIESEEGKTFSILMATPGIIVTGENKEYTKNGTAIIPVGFAIVPELDDVSQGLVISDVANDTENTGNQFVWVPVSDINSMSINTTSGTDENGRYNYQGKLYNFTGTGESTTSTEMTGNYGQGTTSYREPSLITGNENDTCASVTTIYGMSYDASSSYYNTILGYTGSGYSSNSGAIDFGKDMQKDYNAMVESVSKYGGFYIGRYETSINGTTVASKSGVLPMNATTDSGNTWYGMYKKQKEFGKNIESVSSSMIWGSQYDAMLNWALTGSDKGKVTATTNGNHSGNVVNTGTTEKDKINNIYDLEGSLYEWTLEAYYTGSRVLRGGFYNGSTSPSNRLNVYGPVNDYHTTFFGSRLSLYIQ